MSKIDYFAALYPAIEALSPNDRPSRDAVYNRARTIVANRATNSAARNAEITQELAALESAIQRLENEFSVDEMPDNSEWEPAEPIDLTDRSGRTWKAAAALAVIAALGIGGYLTVSSFTERKAAAEPQIGSVRLQAKAVPEVPLTDVSANSDHRPFTERRQLVYYRTTYPPGAVVISKSQKFLYLIRPNLSAMRYSIAVGRKCSDSVGLYQVSEKEEFPGWNDPEPSGQPLSPLLAKNANPLGARALFLERDDRSIHGISRAVSQGSSLACFQLVNEDVIDLFDRVPVGTRVVAAN